jgi:hypothetical protein
MAFLSEAAVEDALPDQLQGMGRFFSCKKKSMGLNLNFNLRIRASFNPEGPSLRVKAPLFFGAVNVDTSNTGT